MEHTLEEVFNRAKCEPECDLAPEIWQAIVLYRKRIARLKLFIFSLLGFALLLGLIAIYNTVWNTNAEKSIIQINANK